ncbi:MAG: DUF1513 domain-containing protein, partial [Pseudomonadota bacterium]
ENDFDAARGVVGVYDVANGYRRIGEFDSFGVGPHDMLLDPVSDSLVIANGGIETHPETGRAKLNIASMAPSLVFIDRHTGDLRARHELSSGQHKLSIRHIDVDAGGRIWFGGQWQGDLLDAPSLVGCAGQDNPITLVRALAERGAGLQGYVGSVTTTHNGCLLAASAPRAGRILVIETQSGDVVGEHALLDGCGVAQHQDTAFVASSGMGHVVGLGAIAPGEQVLQSGADARGLGQRVKPGLARRFPGIAFDNHLVSF